MGYGRINVLRSLDFSDVMIKDWAGDTGVEPSTSPGGDFWDFSDIVIRINDDNVFVPDDISKSRYVERGQTNYLYIRVTNNGPREAENVVVNARITPYVGLQFVYPDDWTLVDSTHSSPTPVTNNFGSIPSGGTVIAKFTISAAQTDDLWDWTDAHPWHPCLLASVSADNDYAFATSSLTGGELVVRRNNLAQRNLTVIDVLAGSTIAFPFIAGHKKNREKALQVFIDRSKLPKETKLMLSLDDNGINSPLVDFTQSAQNKIKTGCGEFELFERTRIKLRSKCFNGILTLEKGSKFNCDDSQPYEDIEVKGGEIIVQDNKYFAEIKEDIGIVTLGIQPSQICPLSLHTSIPKDAKKGQEFMIRVYQTNLKGMVTGGATAIYVAK